jgi:hypothetical protein
VTPTVLPRRVALSSLLAVFVLLFGLVTPAGAAGLPDPTTDPPQEDSNPTLENLRSNLEAAAIGWLDAEAALTASKAKQGDLQQSSRSRSWTSRERKWVWVNTRVKRTKRAG